MDPRRMSRAVVLAMAILCPRAASGQFEGFLEKVNDVNFFFSCWSVRGDVTEKSGCPVGRNGYGLEVSFDLGEVGLPGSRKKTTPGRWKEEKREVVSEGGTTRTIITSTWVAEKTAYERTLQLELALGYSQFSGFQSDNPAFELRGTAREVPSVAMYGTFDFAEFGFPFNVVSPYVGLKSGLIELNNVQILVPVNQDTVSTYTAGAKAFQAGVVYGVVRGFGDRLNVFLERAHHMRKFPHVVWTGPGGGKIPVILPDDLDFSGPTISVGFQVTIKPPK